jgi:hypothetical protein
VSYESRFERFEVVGLDGKACVVEFRRAGFLTVGDRPELHFFAVCGEDVVLAISGSALKKFEETRRRLSREEKIDIAGLMLKRAIEAGKALDSQNLLIRDDSLTRLAGELGIPA